MFNDLLLKQKEQLDHYFAHLDPVACEQFVAKLEHMEGAFFLTGVGKSGFIAQKIVSTLQSTGTRAYFLSPLDAMHGDLGVVSRADILLIFSNSGETEELLQLLPFARAKGACIVAITSNPKSRLAQAADETVHLPCEKELCPYDLAPTSSTVVQLLFGDALAIALMQKRGFTLEQFAENHPGGRIGRRSLVRVCDLMLDQTLAPLCSLEARLEEVLIDFSNKRCGCLIVTNEKKEIQGIFTDGDLRRALQAKGESVLKEKVGNLMTTSPKTIQPEAPAWQALKIMEEDRQHPITVLPVVGKECKVVGIIKMHDLIQAGL